MHKITKILLLVGLFNGILLTGFADKGVGSKMRNKIVLDIKPSSVKKSLSFNLKSGLTYKGSLMNYTATNANKGNTLITYKKGNSIYIIPYKQKLIVSEVGKGYTGMKLIIKGK